MDELERQEQLLREAMRELQESSTVTADTFFRLDKETSKLGKTIEDAEDAIDKFWRGPVGKTTKAFGDVAKGALDAGLAARKNRESFESLNPAIEGVASALSAIPIVGDALGKTLSGVGTFVTAELQRSVEAFQTLGSVGGVGAAGLTGLKDSAREAGLAFDQLAKITAGNAKGLAFATGSTAEGARAVAELTRAAKPFQNQLLALGVGITDQSEYFADYLQINRRLNRSQTRDYRSLATGAADYVKQLNLLSRLTGESADAMKAELEAQMSNVQFRAALQLIPKDLRKGAQNIASVVGSIDKQLGIGIQDMFGGAIGTKAAQDVFKATGGQAQDIIDQYKNRLITQEEALARIQEAALRQRETIGDEFVAVAGNMPHAMTDVMLGMYNLADASNITRESLAKTSAEALAAAQAQDPQTKGMINAQQSLQGFATQMDAFVDSQVMPNATKVIEELVGGLDKVAGGINKLAGVPQKANEADGSLEIDGALADGGPVKAGGTYLVGEEGPELMVPGTSGSIMNADQYTNVRDRILEEYVAQATHMPDMTPKPYKTGPAGQDPSEYDTFQFPNPTSVSSYPGLKAFVDYFLWNLNPGPNWFGREPGMPSAQLTSTSELKRMGSSFQEGLYENHMTRAAYYGAFNWQDWDLDRDGALDIIESGLVRSMLSPGTTDLGFLASEMTGKNNAAMDAFFENEFRKPEFATGGIASGPKSGYTAMLHGTEAVVPLPDGRTIPVEVKNSESNGELVKLMQNMLPLLQQVASNTKTGADTSKQLLRASTA